MAGPAVVGDVLSDPAAVTALLGDLLDQRRSHPGPPARWVVPSVRIGMASFRTVLVPRFDRSGHDVRITAVAGPDSDLDGRLVLDMAPTPTGPSTCTLQTTWQFELRVPLPRTALRLAGPAVDRTVASTVHRIMRRTELAIADAVTG